MQPVARRDPALFRRGMSPASKCLIGLSLSALLVSLDGRASWSAQLRSGLESLLTPVSIALELPREAAREVGRGLSTQGDLLRQIARLQDDNERLRVTARHLETLQRENDELRILAGLPTERLVLKRTVELLQPGRGIASQRFLIASGSRDGIAPGMAIVHPEGVIGQVIATGDRTAEVALITDAGQNTPVQLVRTGVRAVLVGEGVPDRIGLSFLANNADVQPGDLLVTSGLDGVYPAGMAVATVVTVARDTESDFARVACKPAARIDAGRHFAVVVPEIVPADAPTAVAPVTPAEPAR